MDWINDLKGNVTTKKELLEYFDWDLTNEKSTKLNDIIIKFPMSVPRYYLSLIDKEDKNDAIKKLCIPSIDETELDGSFDTSGEKSNTVIVGLQHKYKQTALILSTNKCAMYCRHCFRKRLVGADDSEIDKHFGEIISYISKHKEINNVLITGGDAFLNSNKKIEGYLKELVKIDHLDLIRFGTRTPVVLPSRIYADKELLTILKKYIDTKIIYVITQFNHPKEITEDAIKAINCLRDIGIIIKNQAVLLKGVNDDPKVMAELINKLTNIGVVPYYVFQCRPVTGVKNQFQVPIKKGCSIISKARELMSGQGKCFRYIMSNKRGKVEIIGSIDKENYIFKFHQAKHEEDENKIFTVKLEDNQCWLY